MHWYDFGVARSDVAKWIVDTRQGQPFRLRDICDYKGRPTEEPSKQLDNLMSIGMAHEVIADLFDRELIEPHVDRSKVERYQPVIANRKKLKQWEGLVFPRNMPRHALLALWRGFRSWFWVVLLWFVTLVAGAVVKQLLFG